MMNGEEITANLDACSSIMCKDSVLLEYHMETPNMALANKQNGNSGLERRFCKNLVQRARTYVQFSWPHHFTLITVSLPETMHFSFVEHVKASISLHTIYRIFR